MGWIENIIRYLLIFLEYYSFFYVIFRKDFRGMTKRNVSGIIICCIAILFSMMFGFKLEGNAIPFSSLLLIICIILYFMFDVSVVEMIGLAIGQWLILCMLELTIYLVLKPSGLNNSVLENMIMLVISAILWLYYFVIGKRLEQTLFQLPIKIWYLLDCIMLILTAMMEFFSYVIVEELPEGRVTGAGELLVISGGSLICILLLAMIYYYNRTQNFRLQKELAEIQNEQQREYFQQLLKKEEETRCFRHDIINDLLELQNYCEQQEYDKLKLYLKDTLGIVEDISKSSYDVGNDIINTVINYYLSPIKEKYDVEVDGYIDENILIEQRDLCIVSANLVKNAVEAVKKLESGEIRIRVSKGERYFSIKVENDFEGNLTWGKNGLPVTTKEIKNNHGIGLRNVNEVIRKYDGRYHADIVDGKYIVEVFLKL